MKRLWKSLKRLFGHTAAPPVHVPIANIYDAIMVSTHTRIIIWEDGSWLSTCIDGKTEATAQGGLVSYISADQLAAM